MQDRENKINLLQKRLQELELEKNIITQQLQALIVDVNHSLQINSAVPIINQFSKEEKLKIFTGLFKGRSDVFAKRWANPITGKTGYSPVCYNEWKKNICNKPKIKCSNCLNQGFVPINNEIIIKHLTTDYTIGIYPLLVNHTCWFLAVDFDKKSWQTDAAIFIATCNKNNVPAYLEQSRSGNGGHVWIFFDEAISAIDARRFGAILLTQAIKCHPEIGFSSYDRLFPNQDFVPKGGFGNLIALPLQYVPRKQNNSVFLDQNFNPYPNQWQFLSIIQKININMINKIIEKYTCNNNLSITNNFKAFTTQTETLNNQNLPKSIKIMLTNQLLINQLELPATLTNKLMHLASFQNPEFYKAQAMRLNTFGKPRIISCVDHCFPVMGLPRGCFEKIIQLLQSLKIDVIIDDQRNAGSKIDVDFVGELNIFQQKAVKELLKHDAGILAATTAFGKTVIAANIISFRKTNTLILVHRRQLLEQWEEKLKVFLQLNSNQIGIIGGGKYKPGGMIDIAIMQSLLKNNTVNELINHYGQLIVDECHHVAAVSFERVVRASTAKYVLGLTATLERKNGHQPIVMMQCGQVRYKISAKSQAKLRPFIHTAILQKTNFKSYFPPSQKLLIQKLYLEIINDQSRNEMIVNDVLTALKFGYSPLLLTERREHATNLAKLFDNLCKNVIVMIGNQTSKERDRIKNQLASIPDSEERLLIATGSYIGEGFDDTRLDTLFLTMPISWRGTLAQYVGRLHRLHYNKKEVKIYDYVDNHIVLNKIAEKRKKGYVNFGYTIESRL